jgi:hypothetical protein
MTGPRLEWWLHCSWQGRVSHEIVLATVLGSHASISGGYGMVMSVGAQGSDVLGMFAPFD